MDGDTLAPACCCRPPPTLTSPHPTHTHTQIKHKLVALSGLKEKLGEMLAYCQQVLDGKLPVNNQVGG